MRSDWTLGRRPGLDGLRGVAILLVLVCHWLGASRGADRFTPVGSAGVTVFFVLSGFLITSQLIEEREASGRVALGGFYLRRARRLAPALLFVVVALVVFQELVGTHLLSVAPVLLYYANWAQIGGHPVGALTPAWSLSIEEQFYILWPLVFMASSRWRRGPLLVATIGIAASTAARFALMGGPHGGDRVYFGSDTEAASLLIGVLLAVLAHRGLPPLRLAAWALPASMIGLFALVVVPSPTVGEVWVPTIIAWVAAVQVWATCARPGRLLTAPALRYVGRRSYGLYLWHYPLIWIMVMITGRSLTWGLVALGLAFGAAEVSWRMIEEPIRLRGRRSHQALDTAQVRPTAASACAVSPAP